MLARICISTLVCILLATNVSGHGRMLRPPQRSSMWRFNFSVPTNYNDNELFCGGFTKQFDDVNQGRCGECGDEWSLPRPRPNDEGGMYGTGIIGMNFTEGELVDVDIELTASHMGYFQFRLCKKSSSAELVTQECLDENLLHLSDGTTEFPIPTFDRGHYYPKVQLPKGFTCDYCVLQWWYCGGNNWGECDDGTWAIGCGNQEHFVNCADISIH